MRPFIGVCVVVCAVAATASAAPYETVLVYSKTGSPGSGIEVTLEDLMTKQSKDVTLPTEFTDEDGTFYRLTSIKQQLDVEGIDKHYLAPYWDFSVSISIDGEKQPDLDALLSEAHPSVEWPLPRLLADHGGAKHYVSLNIRGSYNYPYLCGLETVYREKKGADMPKELKDVELTRDRSVKLPTKVILQGPSPILYSFCDNVIKDDSHIESVDWPVVFDVAKRHPELTFGHTVTTIEDLREAHKHALVEAIFGDKLRNGELDIEKVNVGGAGQQPTNVVVHQDVGFTIASIRSLHEKEHPGGLFASSDEPALSTYLDKDSRVTIDLSELDDCGTFFSQPYSIVLTTTDEQITATTTTDKKAEPHKVVIKAPTTGTCVADIKAPWAQFVGRTFQIALLFQLPGSLGKVTVVASAPFKVRQLGLITTFPVVSEVVAAIKGADAGKLTSTSSIPISWAIRTHDHAGGFTAITIPWKISWAARTETDTSKVFAFYTHVSVLIPVDTPSEQTRFAVGAGVSLFEAFHFAWGITTSDHANFILIGLSPTDIVKLIK